MTQVGQLLPRSGSATFPFPPLPWAEPATSDIAPRWDADMRPYFFCRGCRSWVCEYDDPGFWSATAQACCKTCRAGMRGDGTGPVAITPKAEFKHATLLGLKIETRKALESWPNETPFLLVTGCPGAGKTRACWALAIRQARFGRGVAFLTAGEIFSEWARQDQDRAALEVKWAEYPRLILDDLSGTQGSAGWQTALLRLLSARIESRRPTLIASVRGWLMRGARAEWGWTTFAAQTEYDAALLSRLRAFAVVLLPWHDYRTPGRIVQY